MPAPTADDLARIETRLRSILVPYEARLETALIYGIPTLRRPGAKAHDWFAFVKASRGHIGFYLLPVFSHAKLRDGLSPALAGRLTGKSTFTFTALDEALATELEALVARAYDLYMGAGAGG